MAQDNSWTKTLDSLREWEEHAGAQAEQHYQSASRLAGRGIRLGLVTTILCTTTGTLLFAEVFASELWWITIGLGGALAAAFASVLTFQRYAEYAEEHRQIAELWAVLRRDIAQMRALAPEYLEARGDAGAYLEHLRARIDFLSARDVRAVGRGRWRAIADRERAELLAVSLLAAGRSEPPRFSNTVRDLQEDWERRAAATSYAHLAIAGTLSSLNLRLGIPTILLLAVVGAVGFASIDRGDVPTWTDVLLGSLSTVAAVLASLSTFLRFRERAQLYGISAEQWAALRREIATTLTLDPSDIADDPKDYLDDLARRMSALSARSPEIGERAWMASQRERLTVASEDAIGRFRAVFPGVRLSDKKADGITTGQTASREN